MHAVSDVAPPLSSVESRVRYFSIGKSCPPTSSTSSWVQRLKANEIMTTELQHRSPGLMNCQEHLARILALKTGKQSSAGKALAELDCRRAHGEQVCIYPARGAWIVGPA